MPGEFIHLLREPANEPAGAIVLLHGRGDDEHSLYALLDAFDPERRLAGVTVRGPLNLPPGGCHWYRVAGVRKPDPETFNATYESLGAWLDRLPAVTGAPWKRTVIGGFSQGCMMAYALGLGAGRPSPAGIIGLSGFIPRVPGFEFDLAGRAALPVAIGHGSLDPVIPVEFGREARDTFSAAGLDVTFGESPVPHAIDPLFAAELRDWLALTLEA